MENQELIDLLLMQTKLSTVILFYVALISILVLIDVLIHLYKKYIKKVNKWKN